jgi:hypothetical protein
MAAPGPGGLRPGAAAPAILDRQLERQLRGRRGWGLAGGPTPGVHVPLPPDARPPPDVAEAVAAGNTAADIGWRAAGSVRPPALGWGFRAPSARPRLTSRVSR